MLTDRETGTVITRAHIMKRAHLLRSWNKGGETFGYWLARAWAEAKSGRVHLWHHLSPVHEVARLRTELSVCLNANRFDSAHYADLQQRLRAAERLAA